MKDKCHSENSGGGVLPKSKAAQGEQLCAQHCSNLTKKAILQTQTSKFRHLKGELKV